MDHAIVLLDQGGHVVRWSHAAHRIFGYAPEEVLGKHISFLFTDFDNATGAPAHEQQVATSAGASEDDRWHVRQDGAKVWVSGTLTALRDASGQLLGFGKVMRDRTDMRAQANTLENRIGEMYSERQHIQEYFAGLAHEFRNALGPVKNALAIIGAGQAGHREQALDIARRQVDVLTHLVRDAAELATMNVGKLELCLAPLDLHEWLPTVVAALTGTAGHKGQVIELLMVAGPVTVEADAQRLHQVVFNLIHNAIKYTQAGGKIWVKLTMEDRSAAIRVEDNGMGIDGALLPKIFDLFTQASVTGSEGGLGVGLSLVKNLVQAHRGVVDVRSEGLGKGSEFSIRLPLGGSS